MDPISESSTARVSGDTLHYDVIEKDIFPGDVYGSDQSVSAAGSLRTVQPPELLVESVRTLSHDRDSSKQSSKSTLALDTEFPPTYQIESLARRDDIDLLKPWKRFLYLFSSFLTVAAFSTYALYYGLRMTFTLAAQRANRTIYPAAWVFLIVEMATVTPGMLHSLWSIFVLKPRGREKLRLKGDAVPTVDVFVTACGEDEDVILNTARAACSIDYPTDRFRVFVLDDGRSASLFRSITALNGQYPNLVYRSREKYPGLPHHFKAGNLNFGLRETLTTKGEEGEFVAALDADMIPQPEWLRAILPHMLIDQGCGLACPPQLFYNIPPNDPLYQGMSFFAHVAEPIKDALGVAWCTGSGYVVRRCALDSIGDIPVGTVAEDVLCSTLLLGQGWRTAYIHEGLQYGQVPGDFGGHIKQRTRWTVGTMQTTLRLRFSLWGSEIRRLTFPQRASGFMYSIISLFSVFTVISLFAIPGVLISGGRMVAYATEDQLRWLIRSCFLAFAVNRLCELSMYLPSGYRDGQRSTRAMLWMAPYHTITLLRVFVLPSWLGGQTTSFKPTGSLSSALNERSSRERAPLFRRLKVILWNYLGGFHLFYIIFVLAAVIISSVRCGNRPTLDDKLIYLLTHAFWVPVTWLVSVSAAWTPIIYALNPPTMPDTEDLLKRDPSTNVAYPRESSKLVKNKVSNVYFEFQYTLQTLYTTALFIGSWIY
ncbi:hypothetical protein N7G274_002679 [Stereocaulon virgatum]|uniref:Glycosyltransferase 2-like domain-containing protein n=1 Tax=Stereocaulon virgatum TaxID=373712 RepID=A0ABR4AHB4_9LECA